MQVISFLATKGGVGKTTLSYQFSKYLSQHGKKALLLDLDSQRSLSSMFELEKVTYTTENIFRGIGEVEVQQVYDNIDLIPASLNLGTSLLSDISMKPNKELLLFIWFRKNYKDFDYDYVILDLNPAWNLLTMNAATASDLIISPLEPSRFGYESHDKVIKGIEGLKEGVVDPRTLESYVIADLKFIANRVKHNTTTSKEFLSQLETFDDVIGVIPEKEAINASMLERKYVVDYLEEKDHMTKSDKKFIDTLENIFDAITQLGDED